MLLAQFEAPRRRVECEIGRGRPRYGERRCRVAAERDAGERRPENLPKQLDLTGGHRFGIIDERKPVRRMQPVAQRGVRAQNAHCRIDRIAPGHPTARIDQLAVAPVEFRENLGKIDLAPVLPLQFRGRHGERVVIGILDRHEQRRIGEVRRLGVKLGAAGERSRKKLLRINARVAQLANQPERRIQETSRRAQPGNFGVELSRYELFPVERKERCARIGKQAFRFDVIDRRDVRAGRRENAGGERIEAMFVRKVQRHGGGFQRACPCRAGTQGRALAGSGCTGDRHAAVKRRVDGRTLLLRQVDRNHRAKRSGAAGGLCAHAIA